MDEDTRIFLEYGKTGDPALFRKLWDTYKTPVLNTIWRVTRFSPAEAEDLLQEIFISVMRVRTGFAAKAKFSTWLYRIAVNRAFNAVRDRKRTVEPDETLVDTSIDSALDKLIRQERRQVLEEALGRLNERQRAALTLKEYEGKSYAEISEILDCSVEAVESLLFHARSRLRGLLKEKIT